MKNKTVVVIGFGVSGRSAAAFLLKEGCRVIAVDRKAVEIIGDPSNAVWLDSFFKQEFELFSDEIDFPLKGISQAILSPGISQEHPLVQKLLKEKIEVIGEIALAFRHIQNRCIGITGTNGKTTTVLLIAHILNKAGKKARAVGNVGFSLTSYLMHPDKDEILIVELSSYQIETLDSRCLEAAAILNITPNHLDRYPSMAAYAEAKAKIQGCLQENGKLFISRQVDKEYKSLLRTANTIIFDLNKSPWESVASISRESYIQMGVPEGENIRAAFAFCAYFGVSEEDFHRGLETFRKPAHRIEWVADIAGVSYYNDSKSCNIDSVMHAIGLFNGPIILIVGGVDKGASYSPWIECFKGKVKKIIAYGQASFKMEQELAAFFPFSRVHTLQEAVEQARTDAQERDTVLLSPGGSSFDQFRNYEHRGEEFKRLVKERVNA